MAEKQNQINYQAGADFASVAKSPNLEIFRRRGIEVLYLTDPVDEFALKALDSYRGKKLASIDAADIEIPEAAGGTTEGEDAGSRAKESGFPKVLELFRAALGSRVTEVRESKRLTESPCCLVNAQGGISTQTQRLLKMANKEFTESGRILEINPSAQLIRRLCNLSANDQHHDFIKQCGLQLWSDAMILDGVMPEPEDLVARVQAFMTEAAEKRSPLILK
jgi:molecular chaperone HtpG